VGRVGGAQDLGVVQTSASLGMGRLHFAV